MYSILLLILALLVGLIFICILLLLLHPIKRFILKQQIGKNSGKLIKDSGFEYDPTQDIFVSRHDAWQRKYGYTRSYDEMAPFLGMIIDSEPIYFDYNNRRYLIEVWKGQYGIMTGFEVGIYYSDESPDKKAESLLYKCLPDEEMPKISMAAFKKDKRLFVRSEKHWWLTGFVLGKVSKPKHLSLEVLIEFNDSALARAYSDAMIKLGYKELYMWNNNVQFIFKKPFTKKVFTRNALFDSIVLNRNRILCKLFNKYLAEYYNQLDNEGKARYIGNAFPQMVYKK